MTGIISIMLPMLLLLSCVCDVGIARNVYEFADPAVVTTTISVESRKFIVEVKVPLSHLHYAEDGNGHERDNVNRFIEKYRTIGEEPDQIIEPVPLPIQEDAGAVRIYQSPNFNGESKVILIRANECVNINLPYDWRTVRSVDSLGLCVLLWELANCNGRHKIIRGDDDDGKNPLKSRIRLRGFASIELC